MPKQWSNYKHLLPLGVFISYFLCGIVFCTQTFPAITYNKSYQNCENDYVFGQQPHRRRWSPPHMGNCSFLDAFSHLYKMVCPSFDWSIRWSVVNAPSRAPSRALPAPSKSLPAPSKAVPVLSEVLILSTLEALPALSNPRPSQLLPKRSQLSQRASKLLLYSFRRAPLYPWQLSCNQLNVTYGAAGHSLSNY